MIRAIKHILKRILNLSCLNHRINEMRKKDVIRVAFIVYDVSKWKTEELYNLMLSSSRFDPVLVAVMYSSGNYLENSRNFISCVSSLKEKGYSYIIAGRHQDIDELTGADIVFYGEPYPGTFDKGFSYSKAEIRKSLACYVSYYFHDNESKELLDYKQSNLVWKYFVENNTVLESMSRVLSNKASNCVITGLPIQDSFCSAKNYIDAWKPQDKLKKRVIWAPSHTIPLGVGENMYEQSTFLEIAEKMLTIAEKYKDVIQWAFKPHPVLRRKLCQIWGQEKTDAYYLQWAEMANTQLETGQYIDLFMTSDAMIHDCRSFMIEYMYTDKPVLFLDKGGNNLDACNKIAQDAYELHYKASSIDALEVFIQNQVLKNEDFLKQSRLEYKKRYLIPPYGKTASENIINAILGVEEYKKC